MISDKDKLERFTAVINKTADKQVKKQKTKAEEFLAGEYKALSEEMEQKLQSRLGFELDRIQSNANKEISSIEGAAKVAIAKKRDEILFKVFGEVENRVRAFVASDEYTAFLEKSIARISSELGEATFFCRSEDVAVVSKLIGKTAQTDDEIVFGGVRAVNSDGSVCVFDTLDSRLVTARENALQTIDLSV